NGSMYQVVGTLELNFDGHQNYTNYYRELDLEQAVFTTTYQLDGVTYKREVFASQPDQVIVVRLTADKLGKLSFAAGLNGTLQKTAAALDSHTLEMTGLSGSHEGISGQVKFNARARIINKGGTVAADS
ncbi:glycoside hydrolase N-terminal domain-containing protein, partial [Gaoshiqia sediminis]